MPAALRCLIISEEIKIPLSAACFEERIHRKVEEVEEGGGEKKDLSAKTYSTFLTSR
jgi:hypothetical protein